MREDVDEDPAAMNGGEDAKTRAAAEAAKNDPKNKYIPVPDDITLRSAPCPICQDKFEQSFDNEKQDWLWRDAMQIGPRVYHASCYSEMKKDGANTPMRTATPDTVLGKRKAGVSLRSRKTSLEKGLTRIITGTGLDGTEVEIAAKPSYC